MMALQRDILNAKSVNELKIIEMNRNDRFGDHVEPAEIFCPRNDPYPDG